MHVLRGHMSRPGTPVSPSRDGEDCAGFLREIVAVAFDAGTESILPLESLLDRIEASARAQQRDARAGRAAATQLRSCSLHGAGTEEAQADE